MIGLIRRVLKKRSKHGKPDEELLWCIWEDRKYPRYGTKDIVKLEEKERGKFLSFDKVSEFAWSFVRVFGLSTETFVHSIEVDNSGREYDCYISQELAICGNRNTGEVEKVSYYGKNPRVLGDVMNYVKNQKGYIYKSLDTGFMILRDRDVNFELVKG